MFNTGKATMPVASSPCYECPDRFLGCHGTCEKYKAFKEERLELYHQIHEKTVLEKSADAVLINGIQRRRKADGRKPSAR